MGFGRMAKTPLPLLYGEEEAGEDEDGIPREPLDNTGAEAGSGPVTAEVLRSVVAWLNWGRW